MKRFMTQKIKEKIIWPLFEKLWCRGKHTWIHTPKGIMYPTVPYYCKWCRAWKGYKEPK